MAQQTQETNQISRYSSDDLLLNFLNVKVGQLLQLADELSKIDPSTEKVTKPLISYSNGISFDPLGIYGSGHRVNDSERTISLSLEVITRFTQVFEEKESLRIAILVFLCHEVSHISQGVKKHEDVQRMKLTNQHVGCWRMGELDLRSDFWAANTLSLFLMLKQMRTYNNRRYVEWLHQIWCKVCKEMLSAFPTSSRKDKQQRIFGYLLMSNRISNAYLTGRPLEFNAELWPEWSDSLDRVSIFSNGNVFISGCEVNRLLMGQILDEITQGDYSKASSNISILCSQLPWGQ